MADLGAIGVGTGGAPRLRQVVADGAKTGGAPRLRQVVADGAKTGGVVGGRKLPTYLEAGVNSFSADLSGSINGVVQEAGVPVAGRVVRLYYRQTGLPVLGTVSAADGSFLFRDLYVGGLYFVVAFDDLTVGETYNALIYDQVSSV